MHTDTCRRIFGFSSHYQAGSVGRQTIWIWATFIAIMAVVTSIMLPDTTNPDPITEMNGQSDNEEEQGLLDSRE
jgi:hypothetical protein